MQIERNRKFFALALDPELKRAMQEYRTAHGTNWSFVLREAIKSRLNAAHDKK